MFTTKIKHFSDEDLPVTKSVANILATDFNVLATEFFVAKTLIFCSGLALAAHDFLAKLHNTLKSTQKL